MKWINISFNIKILESITTKIKKKKQDVNQHISWNGMVKTIKLDQDFSSVADCLASSRSFVQSAVLQTKQTTQQKHKWIHSSYIIFILQKKEREKWKNENWIK